MNDTEQGPTSRAGAAGWTVFTLLGLAGWLGVTVYVAATNENPSDATPILRTFAVAGAVFFAVVFIGGALGVRRAGSRISESLYRRLAVTEVPPGAVRAAVRRTRRFGHGYLLFTGLATALMLTIIGLGEDGPYELLFAAMAVTIVGFFGYALFALRSVFKGTDELLAPLGLSMVETPGWVTSSSGSGGQLVGQFSYGGIRHGRQVTISQTSRRAVTVVAGDFPRRTLTGAATMAARTGQPAKMWRGVTAQVGADGVTVRRERNGAGRWFLYDLLLAEHLAGRPMEAAITGSGAGPRPSGPGTP